MKKGTFVPSFEVAKRCSARMPRASNKGLRDFSSSRESLPAVARYSESGVRKSV